MSIDRTVAIIDYDAGNIRSVQKACAFLGANAVVTDEANVILSADKVILPGVGAFGDAMHKLKERGLIEVIKELREKDTPLLGICLGLQLLFDGSEESGGVEGLGLLSGDIVRIPERPEGVHYRVPHMGWNSLSFPNPGRLFEDSGDDPYVYFVHSYYLKAKDRKTVTAVCDYGVSIDASVESGNLFACQFHPEKSGEVGLGILRKFLLF